MRNARNLRFRFLIMFLLFIPMMYALPPEGITIKGKVTDETLKEGVPGANVTVKGTSIGAITDFDGNFTIVVPNRKSVLSISFIGYVTQEIVVGDRKFITVTLKEDSQNLGEVEVVAIAYGNQDRRMLTSAVSSIDNKELIKSPATSITNILAGALPGVSSVQTTGQPGKDAAAIYVRGVGSLNDSQSKPLILVDGVERAFSQIDPNEVETISVLKDASSTAVFGVRGANGVILITTRRGKSGKTQISASTKLGLQQPISLVEQTGSYEFARFWNMKQEMDHVTNPKLYFTPEQIEAYRTGSDPIMYPNMDWKKYIFHNLYLQSQNNVNISGGNDNVQYFVSVGYTYQNGLLKELPGQLYDNNYRYNRYNYRANIDANLTKTTTMKLGVGGVLGKIQEPRDVQSGTGNDPNAWVIAQIWSHPFAGPGFINGVRTLVPDDLVPLGEVMRDGMFVFYGKGYNQTYDTTLNMDLDITQKLDFVTPGLSVSVKGAYDNQFKLYKERAGGAIESQTVYYQSYFDSNGNMPQTDPDYDKTHIFVPSGSDTPLTYSESSGRAQNWYLEGRINYDRMFGDHKVSGLILYNQSRNYYPDSYTYLPRNYVGLVGRATYAYQSKYLLDVNVGYNGSENFAPGKRYGFFPAASLGWVISEEKFMKQVDFISFLKLRASYGLVGNDILNEYKRFLYLPDSYSASSGGYYWGVNTPQAYPGASELILGNPDVTWEKAAKQNYGLDMNLLDQRLNFSLDVFFEKRKDILIQQNTVPGFVAADLPAVNLGKVNNKGYEISLGWNDKIGSKFRYWLKGNVSFSRNEIVYKDEIPQNEPYMYETGRSIGLNYGYVFDRFFEAKDFNEDGSTITGIPVQSGTFKPGDILFKDLNNDGVIDGKDRTMVEGVYPKMLYSFNFNVGYKNWDLSVFFQGITRRKIWTDFFGDAPFAQGAPPSSRFLDAWTPENTDTNVPALYTHGYAPMTGLRSTYNLKDAAYLRLKNIQLGYNLPQSLLNKVGIDFLRVYFSGENLFTFTKYPDFDPERAGDGWHAQYPHAKTFSLGLNLKF